jgi:hypothetical protein
MHASKKLPIHNFWTYLRCRWQIQVFFEQIKQTLQLSDFLVQIASAVRWQVWMALLGYVVLRSLACACN